MNMPRNLITLLVCMILFCGSLRASDFKVEMWADGELLSEVELKIEEDRATATTTGEVEQFNLKEMSWLHEDSGVWVTLDQCKAWVAASEAKSRKSMASAPPQIRAFVAWSLDPQFEIKKSPDALRLISGQVDYVIEGIASSTDSDAYFRYAELNAYKKAMTLRKLAPNAELKSIELMRALAIVPNRISVAMPGIPRSPSFEVRIRAVDE